MIIRKFFLESNGFSVLTASEFDETLQIVSSKYIDLVLLDYNLNNIQGPAFIDKLESFVPDLSQQFPIVYLSGMDEVETGKASGFISKLMDMETFLLEIKKYFKLESSEESSSINY